MDEPMEGNDCKICAGEENAGGDRDAITPRMFRNTLILLWITLIAGLLMGHFGWPTPKISGEEVRRVAEANARAEDLKAQLTVQQRFQELQTTVIKACIDKGGVPVLLRGDVGCNR